MEDYPELSFSLEKVNGGMLATIGKKTAQNRLNLSNELCCSAINVCHSGYIPHVNTRREIFDFYLVQSHGAYYRRGEIHPIGVRAI